MFERTTPYPHIACATVALLAIGCGRVDEIDVLTIRKVSVDSREAAVDPREAAVSATEAGLDSPANCIDTSSYPGGGIYKVDFSDLSDLTLNQGASSVGGGAIRVVSTTGTEVGSAYVTTPVAFDTQTSLYARFAMRLGGGAGPAGTDGLAFVMQSSPSGPRAVGIAGGGMGYKLVTPSVVIEFDTFFNPATDPNGNHVALMAHGDDLVHIASAVPAFRINDGVVRNVWVDYDATQKLLEVYASAGPTKPTSALLSHSGFDYAAALGAQVYFGFSAATGVSKNNHDVLGEAWFVTSQLPKCR